MYPSLGQDREDRRSVENNWFFIAEGALIGPYQLTLEGNSAAELANATPQELGMMARDALDPNGEKDFEP